MSDNIEEKVAKIMADAPTIEDHLAPYRQRILELEKQLSATSHRSLAIILFPHQHYVSQFTDGRKATAAASPRDIKKKKATAKKLQWLARKTDNQARSTK